MSNYIEELNKKYKAKYQVLQYYNKTQNGTGKEMFNTTFNSSVLIICDDEQKARQVFEEAKISCDKEKYHYAHTWVELEKIWVNDKNEWVETDWTECRFETREDYERKKAENEKDEKRNKIAYETFCCGEEINFDLKDKYKKWLEENKQLDLDEFERLVEDSFSYDNSGWKNSYKKRELLANRLMKRTGLDMDELEKEIEKINFSFKDERTKANVNEN